MRTSKLVLILLLVVLLSTGTGAAAAWYLLRPSDPNSETAEEAEVDTRAYRYVNLEKIIVMLRNSTGEPVSHYLALDLVLKTPIDNERITREHLPLLRSVAVQALSTMTFEEASRATVEDLTRQINEAYSRTYEKDRAGKPFTEAMIGKLLLE